MDGNDVGTGVVHAEHRSAVHGYEIKKNEIVVLLSTSSISVHPKYGYEVSGGGFVQWPSDQVRIA